MNRVVGTLGLATVMLGLLAGGSGRAEAALVTYTDRTSFEAATHVITTIDFEDLAPPAEFTYFPSPPGLSIEGVTFMSVTDTLFVIDPLYSFPDFVWTSGQYLIDNTAEPDVALRGLVAELPAGIYAFGTDVSSFGLGTVQIELSTGELVTVESPGQPELTFIGFISDVPIASLTFNIPDDAVVLDNVVLGVPEPATLVGAAISGLLTLGYLRRRRAGAGC